jgi:hypothetical protein
LDSNIDLAVKRPNDTKDNIIDLFKDEIIQWIRLTKHHHITTCFYYKTFSDGIPRLFIEYVDGGHLEEWHAMSSDCNVSIFFEAYMCHSMDSSVIVSNSSVKTPLIQCM